MSSARSAAANSAAASSANREEGEGARLHTKVSFGVIVTRICAATRRPEAVLVRGRYTYEFAEFVHGRYSRKNTRAVAALIDAMSVNERLDIYSLDFAQMWYRIWLTADRRELYNKKFAKFQAVWMRDDSGEHLRRLVQASRPVQNDSGVRLGFPKGRRQSGREPDLYCAIRETEEETGIAKRDYQILPGFKRRVSHVHMGVRYVSIYYAAVARRDLAVGVNLRDLDQVSEISEVRWLNIDQIRLLDTPDRRLERTVAPVFRYVKRCIRGLAPPLGLAWRKAGVESRGARADKARAGAQPRRKLGAREDVSVGAYRQPARAPGGNRKREWRGRGPCKKKEVRH